MKNTASKKTTWFYLLILISILAIISCNSNTSKTPKEEILLFAAAGLTDVISEVIDSFETETGIKVTINFASSGTLARQIEQGTTPDLYISASKGWANYIDSLGYTKQPYCTEIAKNRLVLVSPKDRPVNISRIDSSVSIASVLNGQRLSIGDPKHVPAGNYAQQALIYYNQFKNIENQLLPAKDVRSALMVVELGESPLGIVYKTDALKSEKVDIVATFPKNSHKPIVFTAMVCNETNSSIKLFEHLKTGKNDCIWTKHGFIR